MSAEATKETLYRTQFLMAHNRLHAILVNSPEKLAEYLAELKTAPEVALRPA